MIDDRVSCFECDAFRRCRGKVRADPDLLRRCELFRPKAGAHDRRTGAQRFPFLNVVYQKAAA